MKLFKITSQSVAQARRLAQVHDEARARAQLLRADAIDNFWRGANEVLGSACGYTLASVRRSGQRLGYAMARHHACRSANQSAPVSTIEGN
jgi:hypothetical protein